MPFSIYFNLLTNYACRPSWDAAKKIMSDVNFMKKLMDFDKEHITEATLKKIKVYIDHSDFDPLVSDMAPVRVH